MLGRSIIFELPMEMRIQVFTIDKLTLGHVIRVSDLLEQVKALAERMLIITCLQIRTTAGSTFIRER